MAPGAQREPKGPKETKGGGHQGAGAGPIRNRGAYVYRGEFRQSVEDMMYAFGDVEKPDGDSVALMEDMTLSFLVDLCHRARPSPHKIPIPSNQNVINKIANAVLAQEAALEAEDASTSTSSSSSSSLAARKKAASSSLTRKDRISGGGGDDPLSTSAKRTFMPPRLVAHPYVARPRMTVEDLKFACRKDAKLSSRIEELLYLDKVITAAQKAFDNPEEDVAAEEAAS